MEIIFFRSSGDALDKISANFTTTTVKEMDVLKHLAAKEGRNIHGVTPTDEGMLRSGLDVADFTKEKLEDWQDLIPELPKTYADVVASADELLRQEQEERRKFKGMVDEDEHDTELGGGSGVTSKP